MLLCGIGLQRFCLDPATALPCALLVSRHADAPRKVRLHSVSLRMTHTAVIKSKQKTKNRPCKMQEGDKSRYHLCSPQSGLIGTKMPFRITGDTVTAYLRHGAFGVQLARVFGKVLSPSYTNRRLSAQRKIYLLCLVTVFTRIV